MKIGLSSPKDILFVNFNKITILVTCWVINLKLDVLVVTTVNMLFLNPYCIFFLIARLHEQICFEQIDSENVSILFTSRKKLILTVCY